MCWEEHIIGHEESQKEYFFFFPTPHFLPSSVSSSVHRIVRKPGKTPSVPFFLLTFNPRNWRPGLRVHRNYTDISRYSIEIPGNKEVDTCISTNWFNTVSSKNRNSTILRYTLLECALSLRYFVRSETKYVNGIRSFILLTLLFNDSNSGLSFGLIPKSFPQVDKVLRTKNIRISINFLFS